MSETDNKTSVDLLREDFSDPFNILTEWNGRTTDDMLQWLVNLVNGTDLNIGITLTVGPVIITGTLVSVSKYFEQLADDFASGFRHSSPEDVDDIRKSIIALTPIKPEPGEERPAPQFIHLENSCILSVDGRSIPTNPTALWRGKVSAVSGFTLGILAKS
jgi:hypothetical protein